MCEREREGGTDRQKDRARGEGGSIIVREEQTERERFLFQAISHEPQWH